MKIKSVPAAIWEQMSEYVEEDAILIPEPYLQKMPADVQARLHDIDGMDVNYNYGGQPDRCLDIVTDADHYAIQQLMEGQNESR